MVPRPLLLFFRTLMRDFEPQPEVTLRFRRAGQWQLCSRWATTTDYDARAAAGHGPMPCGVAGGLFAWGNILLEFLDASKGALSGSNAHTGASRGACTHCPRVPRARSGRPPSALTQPTTSPTDKNFFCGRGRSLCRRRRRRRHNRRACAPGE